jgi:predicted transposase YdaD
MLTKESPVMASAVDRLVYASGTKELREQMDDYERNEMKNRLTRVADKKETKLEIARKILASGKTVNEVVEWTGLTVDEVLRLQQ